MHTRSQTLAMDVDERCEYEYQFKAQWKLIAQPIKCTLLDGREFIYNNNYATWIDTRDGQRKYQTYVSFFQLTDDIKSETGIPEGGLILLDADTGERINPPGYEPFARIPHDLTSVMVHVG